MLWNDIELFNIDEIEKREDGALLLHRFPKDVLKALGGKEHWFSKYVGRFTTGCEIRFCGNAAAITLSGWEADGIVEVYRGDFFHSRHRILHGKPTTIMLSNSTKVDNYDVSSFKSRFSADVWRIVMAHDFCAVLHGVEALSEIRPPRKEETPKLKMLAYGSSITHGAGATTFSHAYISRAARLLDADVLNKGMGGSCFCENEVADYLAELQWDFAVFELGINMIGLFSVEEFERRSEYMVSKVLETGRLVFLVTHYPHFRSLPCEKEEAKQQRLDFYNVLKRIYKKYQCEKLVLIDGADVLTDFTGLTCDLIHPSDYGHSIMAENLARIINENK